MQTLTVLAIITSLLWPLRQPTSTPAMPARTHVAHVDVKQRHARHMRRLRELRERRARARRRRVRHIKRTEAVHAAESQLGVPYVWGAESPGWGFDCSGLVQWAWGRAGVWIPRTTWSQTYSGIAVSLRHLYPGDLVFAEGGGHVGLYIGGGVVIAAPHTGAFVSRQPLSWFGAEWARRIAR